MKTPSYHLRSHAEHVAYMQDLYENRPNDLIEAVVTKMRKDVVDSFQKRVPKEYKDASLQNFGYFGDEVAALVTQLFEPEGARALLFHGSTGSGKTYAAYGASNMVLERDPQKMIMFEKYPLFVQKLRKEFLDGDYNEWASTWERANNFDGEWGGLVVLDDLGANKLSEFEIEKLYTVLDQRISNYEPTIVTTNCPPEEHDAIFGPRVASRLARFTTVEFPNFDFRTLK